MKTVDGPSICKKIIRAFSIIIILVIIGISCYVYNNYCTYNSIKIITKKSTTVEYGSANYNIKNLIKKVDGKIVSVKKDIDTKTLGNQEVILEVKKQNVTKNVPIVVSVVDTVAPVIQLKEEKVTITAGDDYDLTYNVENVNDEVDGNISYSSEVNEDSKLYYNFDYNTEEIDNVGSHEVKVVAKDNTGNSSIVSFILEVEAPKVVYSPRTDIHYNVAPNAAGGDMVSLAYSYVGYPYISGSNGPYGFDCSGFVQYIYSCFGISISRSTSTQIYDGVGVSYADAQPGDILLWGYSEGHPTHSALYVGNGQMVHATNPSQGVLASDVAAWTRGSGTHVIAVRRIS